MKSAVIATIAAIATAQDVAAESKTVGLSAGAGSNAKGSSTADAAVAVIAGVSGTLVITQTVDYPAPVNNNIVQSWIAIEGAAEPVNGEARSVYAFANGSYGSNVASKATINTYKTCGNAADLAAKGANTARLSLSTSKCSLAVQ
jgi:hypothetical protein